MGKDDFHCFSQEFGTKVLDLATQEGFYPYEYMSDFEMFKEELPIKNKFYSSMIGRKMSDKDYEHVPKVWDKFEMKIMKDYLDLYLKCDVLLLANVFDKFWNSSLWRKSYELCLSHHLSAPALNWDAMFNMTKVYLELISDADMYFFFFFFFLKKGMRGRVSYISKRYSKVNNNYWKSNDPKQEPKHFI